MNRARTATPPAAATGDGVRVTVAELVRLRAEAAALVPGRPDLVAGLLPGLYRSLFRGRGLDF